MGEYGTYKGQEIKIGTCEDMYYLRPDQVGLVRSSTLRNLTGIRFRFPFPGEDNIEPGNFDDPDKGWPVWGFDVPADVEHYSVQFKAHAGILVSLPCPYSAEGKASGVKYHFNGFRGPAKIVQQRVWAGVWATVLDCGCCGARFRLPDLESARPVIESLRREAVNRERDNKGGGKGWLVMAERIEAGYGTPAPETS